jgi:hypothetical protein
MNREDILIKAAKTMHDTYGPTQARDERWRERSISMYLERFRTGLNAVEDDIRRDERNRITAWLRECADRPELRFHASALNAMADELDRRPIGD